MSVAMRELGQIASIFVGVPTPAALVRNTGRSGNVLTVRCLSDTGIDLDQAFDFDFRGRDVDKYQVHAGDLLVSARSTSLRMAVVPDELAGRIINATLIAVRCLPTLHPRLLMAWLAGPEGQAAIETVSQSGTHQMNLTVTGLSTVVVPIPALNVQQQTAQLLELSDNAYIAATQAAEDRRRIVQQIVLTTLKVNGNQYGKN